MIQLLTLQQTFNSFRNLFILAVKEIKIIVGDRNEGNRIMETEKAIYIKPKSLTYQGVKEAVNAVEGLEEHDIYNGGLKVPECRTGKH